MDSIMSAVASLKVDKTALTVASLSDQSDEKVYWLAQSPYERLRAVEILRQINYGYYQSTARLQRVLEITHLKTIKKAAGRYIDLDDLENLP